MQIARKEGEKVHHHKQPIRYVNMDKHLQSENGFLIRPFVRLIGQRDGYRWNATWKGLWLDFLNSNRKKFGCDETGMIIFAVF